MSELPIKKQLETIDLKSPNANSVINEYLQRNMEEIPYYVIPLKINTKVFRSRLFVNCKFDNFSDVLNQQDTSKIDYGRANFPQQSLLYLSDNVFTTFKEIQFHLKEEKSVAKTYSFVTAEFEIIKNEKISFLPDLNNEKLMTGLGKHVSKIEVKDYEYLKYINSHIKKPTHGDFSIYIISSSILNYIMEDKDVFGVQYTSVNDEDGWNLALLPKVIDDGIIKIIRVGKIDIYFDGCNFIQNSIRIKDFADLNHEKKTIKWHF